MMVSLADLFVVGACLLTCLGVEAFLIVRIVLLLRENRELNKRNLGQAHTLNHLVQQVMDAERKLEAK